MKLQCGWEDECESKSCYDCPRKYKVNLTLTEAEVCCIEDFATLDIKSWLHDNKEDLDLSQNIMFRLMKKIFKEVNNNDID